MYHSSIVRGESVSSYPPPLTPEQQAHFPPLPPQFPRRKNWFDRNWKWFIPTLVVAILCLVGGFIAVLYLSVDLTFRSSDVCKIAVAQATASPAVRAKLGTPLRVGHSFSGSLNLYGTSGDANLEIPVSGPRHWSDRCRWKKTCGPLDLRHSRSKRRRRWAADTACRPRNTGQPDARVAFLR